MRPDAIFSYAMKYLVLPFFLFLSACNLSAEVGGHKVVDADVGGKSSSFSYDMTDNGCATGKKEFSSLDSLCEGLRDDAQNNNCARGLRYEKFKQDCSGKTW
jgi:hypothetical protein